MSTHTVEVIKHATDIAAAGVAVGAVVNWLPDLAAMFTIIWLAIRIWETDTVRRWTKRYP